MRLAIRSVGMAAGVALALTGSAAAADIKLVTGNDYKPFTDENLPEGGMASSLVRAVYAQVDADAEILFRPWKRGYNATLKGTYAATFPYVFKEKRNEEYRYSDPIYTIERKPMVTADSGLDAANVQDLSGKTYCMPVGYAAPSQVETATKAGELSRERPSDMGKCIRMLNAGRVDFVLTNEALGSATARDVFGDTKPVRFLDMSFSKSELHVLFPRGQDGSQAAMKRFNEGLATIRENGTYDEIVSRYINQ